LADPARSPSVNRKRLVLIVGLAAVLLAGGVFADYWSAMPQGIQPTYVGRQACVDCHRAEAEAYTGSHHDLAMDVANEETVLADFDNATLQHEGMVSRMYRDGDRFMVHTEGESGEMEDFQVKYVFGYEPLQQYMVEFGRTPDMADDEIGRLQVLRISWDTEKKKWFYLPAPDVDEKLEPDDPLHWTGISQRWQTYCADCHSTNLKRNYDSDTQQYHTTFTDIDVSCEACHGPGSLHVKLANSKSLFWDRRYHYGLAKLKGEDAEPQLQACAPCHSRRSVLSADYSAGDPYCDHFRLEMLHENVYHHDGQIKDEVYVYGSFIQSRMYHKGIRCSDCHDPHSLKLKFPGNQTCTSCHQHAAGKYDVPSHHHHQPGTAGAMCVNCHMPHKTYMEVDPRRDHSLRIPRPDLSVKIGTPNACSSCHVQDQLETIPEETRASLLEYSDWLAAADGDDAVAKAVKAADLWCDQACDKWYGPTRRKDPHFAETFAAFRKGQPGADKEMLQLALKPDEQVPPLARATALQELGYTESAAAVHRAARKILDDPDQHPMVRAAAVSVFTPLPSLLPDGSKIVARALMPHLKDSSRLIRTEAARVLVTSGAYPQLQGTEQGQVDMALREVREAMMYASDRAGAHIAWAELCEARQRFDEAINEYQTAMRIEPDTVGPRGHLSNLIESLAGSAPDDLRKQYRDYARQLRAEELPLIARDAALAPEIADVQFRYAASLYLNGRLKEAFQQVDRAIQLAPEIERYQQFRDELGKAIANQETPTPERAPNP
jgi:tetratricopeptide (TPR) repeat protein